MRRLSIISLVIATATLASACGSDDTGDASQSEPSPPSTVTQAGTEQTAPEPSVVDASELTASFRGVTPEAIRLGVYVPDLEAIAEIANLDHGDYQASFQVVIDEVNANGGVLGRTIEPVFEKVSPIDAVAAEAACVALTQDTEVFAVIGGFFEDQALCFVDNNEMAVVGGDITTNRLSQAKAPWYSPDSSVERAVSDVVASLAAAGEFDGATVGLLVGSGEQEIADEVTATLSEAGVTVTQQAVLDTSVLDPLVVNPAVAAIAERFQVDGVDTVLAPGTTVLPTFLGGLQETGYRPRMLGTDIGSARGDIRDAAQNDLSVLEGAVVGGQAEQLIWWDDPEVQACIGLIEASDPGLEILDPNTRAADEPENIVSIYNACRIVDLFVAIAEAAGPDLTYETFQAGAESLTEIDLPGSGPASFGPDKPDGNDAVYRYEWNEAAQDLVSDGDPL